MGNPDSEYFLNQILNVMKMSKLMHRSWMIPKKIRLCHLSISVNDDQLKVDTAREIIWSLPLILLQPQVCGMSSISSNFKEINFFYLFLSSDLLDELALQTNIYARQLEELISEISNSLHTAKWLNTIVNELKKFLSVTLLVGHMHKGNILEYWSRKKKNNIQ